MTKAIREARHPLATARSLAPVVAVVLTALMAVAPGGRLALADPATPLDRTESEATLGLREEIMRALDLPPLLAVMSEEARLNAVDGTEWMAPAELALWTAGIGRINAPARMETLIGQALDSALAGADQKLIREALDFYRSELGQKVVRLEIEARRKMISAEGEAAAFEAVATAGRGSPRIAAIARLMSAGDVVERNLAGSLNASLANARGYDEGAGVVRSEEERLGEARLLEPEVRQDITRWVEALLFLGYGSLSDAEFEEVTDFVGSPAGDALANVVNAAFDSLFERLAYETGLLSAAQLYGTEL